MASLILVARTSAMNEETYRVKNYELELKKLELELHRQIELSRQQSELSRNQSRHWFWQRGVWIATLAIAGTALVYEIAGRGA